MSNNGCSTLSAQSAEMARIAIEGNACSHATDRVADVFQLADDETADRSGHTPLGN
jgi:hypothetical protein